VDHPCVEVLIDNAALTPVVTGALERLGADVLVRNFDPALRPRPQRRHQARLVITSDARRIADGKLPALLKHCDADPCATLVLAPFALVAPPDAMLAARPIDFATASTVDDLTGRLTTMCRMQASMASLRAELEAMRRRSAAEAARAQEFSEQVRLATQVQKEMLPQQPPAVEGLDIRTWFAPAADISGDTYDVHRLDETHVAFALADATGHGIPAALISVFIRRSLEGKVMGEGGYRLLKPDEVLRQLNQDVLRLGLSQCQFLAALYAVFDEETRELTWARGGAPFPILVRQGRGAEQCRSAGPLVGVLEDAEFEPTTVRLSPGDAVMFYTDGVEDVLAAMNPQAGRIDVSQTAWYGNLGHRGLWPSLDALEAARHHASLSTDAFDDITVIAMGVPGSAPESPGSRLAGATA